MRRSPRRPLTPILATTVAALIAGCGIANPYQSGTAAHADRASEATATAAATGTSTASPPVTVPPSDGAGTLPTARALTAATPAHERGGTIPPAAATAATRLAAGVATATPEAALKRYAQLAINWTAATVGPTERRLAAISVGGARATALQTAASDQHDTTLLASQVRNSGTVVAIAPDQAQAGVWVIVTRERTLGQGDYAGLPAQLHITLAQVEQTSHGWVVSTWSPQT